MSTQIRGFDISHNDDPINWDKISLDFKFVFVKASQGKGFKDPQFNATWQKLKTLPLYRGAYHFLTATDTAQSQADNFLSRGVDFTKAGVLPPVLDVEDMVPASLNAQITKDKPAFIQLVTDWLAIVAKETGRVPMIYSYKGFFHEYLNDHSWPNNPLWLASYQATPPGLPKGYTNYTFWQNSEFGQLNGSLTGGGFDLDVFNGTMADLNKLANIK